LSTRAIWYVSIASWLCPSCMYAHARLLYASQYRGFSFIAFR